jgi:hypothetical protein
MRRTTPLSLRCLTERKKPRESAEDDAEQFDETRLYGAKTGSLRSAVQTEIAIFWTENTVRQYNRASGTLGYDHSVSGGVLT